MDEIPAADADRPCRQRLLVKNVAGRVAAVITVKWLSDGFNTKSMQTIKTFWHQDKAHASFLPLARALIDTAAVSLRAQRYSGHQAGDSSAKDCDVHPCS